MNEQHLDANSLPLRNRSGNSFASDTVEAPLIGALMACETAMMMRSCRYRSEEAG